MISKEAWYREAEGKAPRQFKMIRRDDIHGISGEGHVLNGVEWPNGKITVCWLGDKSSVAVYDSFEIFKQVHMQDHGKNSNEVIWEDGSRDTVDK